MRNYSDKNVIKVNTNRNFSALNNSKDLGESITGNPLSHSKETYIRNFKTNFMTNYKEKVDSNTNAQIPLVKHKRRFENIMDLQKKNSNMNYFSSFNENLNTPTECGSTIDTSSRIKNSSAKKGIKKTMATVDWKIKPLAKTQFMTLSKTKFINDMLSRNPLKRDDKFNQGKELSNKTKKVNHSRQTSSTSFMNSEGVKNNLRFSNNGGVGDSRNMKPNNINANCINPLSKSSDLDSKKSGYFKFAHVYHAGKGYYL
jgi:hypothetical protein